jgi:hypothetical protein
VTPRISQSLLPFINRDLLPLPERHAAGAEHPAEDARALAPDL